MFKKISLFLVLALVIGALIYFASSEQLRQTTLTEEKKMDIVRAYFERGYSVDLVALGEGEGKDIYLGTYDGGDIVYFEGFGFRSYKDGEFIKTDRRTNSFLGKVRSGEETLPADASKKRLSEIEEKWMELCFTTVIEDPYYVGWVWKTTPEDPGDSYYYGTYREYDILFHITSLSTVEEIRTIAGETFYAGNPFNMFAYKNGRLYALEDLYEQGKISAEIIKQILERHKELYPEIYGNYIM